MGQLDTIMDKLQSLASRFEQPLKIAMNELQHLHWPRKTALLAVLGLLIGLIALYVSFSSFPSPRPVVFGTPSAEGLHKLRAASHCMTARIRWGLPTLTTGSAWLPSLGRTKQYSASS